MVRPHTRARLLTLLLIAGLCPAAFAQDEQRSESLKRETRSQRAAQTAADQAAQQAPFLERSVTYQELLADPDNLDLNLAYARGQVTRGDLLGASATLERIVLVNPDLAQVRLFRGIVLFRLDNLDEASRELAAVRKLELPPSVRQEVDEYLIQIRRKRQRTRWSSTTTTGFEYDRNRNAAPSSKNSLVLDAMTPVEGTSRRRHDTAVLFIETLEANHDLGMQAGHTLLGSLTYYLGEQTRVDDLDLQAFSFEGGAAIHTPWMTLTPEAIVDHIMLSRETYLRDQGGRVKFDHALTARLGLFGKTDWLREDFSGINENSAAFERAGSRVTVQGGANYAIIPTMQLSGSLAYDHKEAKTVYYTYDALTLEGSHTWILPRSQFVLNALEFELDAYDGPDPAVSAATRHDKQFHYRATYGLPISSILWMQAAQPVVHGLTATASFEQVRALSTLANYTYANSKFTVLLTKKLEF